ncbi:MULTISPECIES: hypothetical protein [Pseudomonas]|jgi:hypothetical protein|uniref:Nucleotide-diphospho-sugar transferase domain-containing protein n=1 Tax=Pseudomonas juntendi TaxID=2666183 RepID=A0A7W2Q986_9PSED|nr:MULTISPECIES: hypothetical protein [Pseudomonas]MBA6097901.1 hypothetical protein [Pseudomonas juntendi]MBH3376505.1 hypothetical protein [Pseudomonas juntendi]MBS6037012.1 hypothetical protein [Pseudomonas sp.]CAH0646953.1 hypothetical protein PSNVIR_01200 [Pseudomonas sp. Nvir]
MQHPQPSRPQLVYLAFGPATYHQEACFSIISALAQLGSTASSVMDIQVYTDNPQPYAGLPVTTHVLDEATRQAWNAPHGYHFRSKHVLLRQVLRQHPLAVLIDTDTFFRKSPLQLFDRVAPGKLLCNTIGPHYGANPKCLLYKNLLGPLQSRGLADCQMPLVNSGVIGLTAADAGTLDRSIDLMDTLYPLAREAYTLEEFCLAVAAHGHLQLAACSDVIHHYWSRKAQFRAKIQAWLAKHGQHPLSPAALADVALVNDQLPRPPALHRLGYKALSLTLPPQERQFARELLYGCYPYANEFDRACASAWWDKALENLNARHGPTDPERLRQCLRHPGLRLSLGERRKDIEHHLLRSSHA